MSICMQREVKTVGALWALAMGMASHRHAVPVPVRALFGFCGRFSCMARDGKGSWDSRHRTLGISGRTERNTIRANIGVTVNSQEKYCEYESLWTLSGFQCVEHMFCLFNVRPVLGLSLWGTLMSLKTEHCWAKCWHKVRSHTNRSIASPWAQTTKSVFKSFVKLNK